MLASQHSKTFLHIFLFTLALRILAGAILFSFFDVNPTEEYYDEIASNLVLGNGYTEDPAAGPNLWRAPLYPFLLAGLYLLFGFSHLPTILVQAVFDALTCAMVYLIGRRTFNEGVAIVSAMCAALYPFFSYYTVRIFSESIFTLSLALLVWSLLRAHRSLATSDFILLGVTLGLGLLCKPVLALFPLVIVVGLLSLEHGSTRRLVLHLSLMLIVTVLLISPWSVRNYQVTGRIVPVSSGGGYNFWLSNHLPTGGLDYDQLDPAGREVLERTIAGIIGDDTRPMTPENDRLFLQTAYKELVHSPMGFLRLQTTKLFRFWFSTFNPANKHMDRVLIAVQLPILLLAGFGILGSLRKDYRLVTPLLLVIVYFVVVNTLVPVSTFRYSIPIMPYVIIFASCGIKELVTTFARPGHPNRLAQFLAS